MSNTPTTAVPAPKKSSLRDDIVSGFFVSLIALPLCLGIAMASGYPPIAGLFTAIIGGLLCPLISNSELTIKGPAAGLIVIVLGAVTELGDGDPQRGYQLALGVGVVAGVIQILFGALRIGVLGEMFPLSAVHGMLAAIGVIIFSKQIHTVLGVRPEAKAPLQLLAEIPHSVANAHPLIAVIGLTSLAVLAIWPLLKIRLAKKIPAPVLVLLFAIGGGLVLGLTEEHSIFLAGNSYTVGPKFLVELPGSLASAIQFPDFSAVTTGVGIKYIAMFSIVGALESLLSAKAVEGLDPQKRRANMDRDLIAIGFANTLASLIGGLPMISEIVRSSANINNGGKTRWANFFHGACLLSFIVFFPAVIHRIPLAALGAMLVYTGCRLASPYEFWKTLKIGREQLVIFGATMLGVLTIDLLVGIGIGIATKILIHLYNGAPFGSFFKPDMEVTEVDPQTVVISARKGVLFTGWLKLKRLIGDHKDTPRVIVDLSLTRLVDHTVMEKLHAMQKDFRDENRVLEIRGLEEHQAVSSHPLAARFKAD